MLETHSPRKAVAKTAEEDALLAKLNKGEESKKPEEEKEGSDKAEDAGDEDADAAFNTTADESQLASKVFGRDREIQDSQADW